MRNATHKHRQPSDTPIQTANGRTQHNTTQHSTRNTKARASVWCVVRETMDAHATMEPGWRIAQCIPSPQQAATGKKTPCNAPPSRKSRRSRDTHTSRTFHAPVQPWNASQAARLLVPPPPRLMGWHLAQQHASGPLLLVRPAGSQRAITAQHAVPILRAVQEDGQAAMRLLPPYAVRTWATRGRFAGCCAGSAAAGAALAS